VNEIVMTIYLNISFWSSCKCHQCLRVWKNETTKWRSF